MLPSNIKLLIYFANIQSYVSYALSVCWKSEIWKRSRNSRTSLEGKFISNGGPNKLGFIKDFFQILKLTLPMWITNLFNISGHDFYTRNRNSLRAPQHTIENYNKSHFGQAPHLWLYLINRLKQKNGVSSFAKAFVKFKMKNY